MVFHDVAAMPVSTNVVSNLPIGACIKSSERPIVESKHLRWAIHIVRSNSQGFRVDLWVSSTDSILNASGKFQLFGTNSYMEAFAVQFDTSNCVKNITTGYCFNRFGAFGSVKVDVTFTGYEEELKRSQKRPLLGFTINNFIKCSNHYSSDARIVVGKDTLEVHRHILCLISPVFHAAFTHDTSEAKSGTIIIKDFDFATVKNVIDSCYGRECYADSLADYINMLRFTDKYDVRLLTESLEPFINDGLTLESFCTVANYAWDLDKTDLKSKCAKFYKDNVAQVTFCPEFVNMNPATIVDIIRLGGSADNQK